MFAFYKRVVVMELAFEVWGPRFKRSPAKNVYFVSLTNFFITMIVLRDRTTVISLSPHRNVYAIKKLAQVALVLQGWIKQRSYSIRTPDKEAGFSCSCPFPA